MEKRPLSAPPVAQNQAGFGLSQASSGEDELRRDPAYFAYYHQHRAMNPRLPPPLYGNIGEKAMTHALLSSAHLAPIVEDPAPLAMRPSRPGVGNTSMLGLGSFNINAHGGAPSSMNGGMAPDGRSGLGSGHQQPAGSGVPAGGAHDTRTLLERIQADFPRTPSPVATGNAAATLHHHVQPVGHGRMSGGIGGDGTMHGGLRSGQATGSAAPGGDAIDSLDSLASGLARLGINAGGAVQGNSNNFSGASSSLSQFAVQSSERRATGAGGTAAGGYGAYSPDGDPAAVLSNGGSVGSNTGMGVTYGYGGYNAGSGSGGNPSRGGRHQQQQQRGGGGHHQQQFQYGGGQYAGQQQQQQQQQMLMDPYQTQGGMQPVGGGQGGGGFGMDDGRYAAQQQQYHGDLSGQQQQQQPGQGFYPPPAAAAGMPYQAGAIPYADPGLNGGMGGVNNIGYPMGGGAGGGYPGGGGRGGGAHMPGMPHQQLQQYNDGGRRDNGNGAGGDYQFRPQQQHGGGGGRGGRGGNRRGGRGGGGRDGGYGADHQQQNQHYAGQQAPGGSGPGAGGAARSPIVEDFRTGRFVPRGLRDLAGHALAFATDAFGCRFLQQQLDACPIPGDRDAIFSEIFPSALQLMTDQCGAQLINRYFETGTVEQKLALAGSLHEQVLNLSLHPTGCRVIQKALECLPFEARMAVAGELDGHVIKCIQDANGNHVIQAVITHVKGSATQAGGDGISFLLRTFDGNIVRLASHPYGCRIVQRLLEHASEAQLGPIMADLLRSSGELLKDSYGNYVIQHLMQHGRPEHRSTILAHVLGNVLVLSLHKFASNVVERALEFGSASEKRAIVDEILNPTMAALRSSPFGTLPEETALGPPAHLHDRHHGRGGHGGGDSNGQVGPHGLSPAANAALASGLTPLQILIRDQFGNYVAQRILDVADDTQRAAMVEVLLAYAPTMRRFAYGKHILTRLEKMVSSRSLLAVNTLATIQAQHQVQLAGAANAAGAGAGAPPSSQQQQQQQVPNGLAVSTVESAMHTHHQQQHPQHHHPFPSHAHPSASPTGSLSTAGGGITPNPTSQASAYAQHTGAGVGVNGSGGVGGSGAATPPSHLTSGRTTPTGVAATLGASLNGSSGTSSGHHSPSSASDAAAAALQQQQQPVVRQPSPLGVVGGGLQLLPIIGHHQ